MSKQYGERMKKDSNVRMETI